MPTPFPDDALDPIAATLRALDYPAHEARTHSQSFLHGGNSVALA